MYEDLLADPVSRGVDRLRLDDLYARAARDVTEGPLPSAQLAVAREGRIVGRLALGRVRSGGREVPATDSTLYVGFSATKALVASAAWLLLEEGKLALDERVADLVPGFERNGKERVTVLHLLTHTAGFPNAPFRPLEWEDPARRLERFASWRLDWEPGTRYGYHPTSGMWVLAEIFERRCGQDYREWIRSRITRPLGLSDFHLGLPPGLDDQVADVVHVGEPLSEEEQRKFGIELPAEITEETLERFNEPPVRAVGVPGGGGIMTASALALFYQALLGYGRARLWKPETVERARTIHTGTLRDPMLGIPANRGLGVVVAGGPDRVAHSFGRSCSERAFGHMGAGGQIAWADPETGLSFAYLTSGHDRNLVRQMRRGFSLSNRASELTRAPS